MNYVKVAAFLIAWYMLAVGLLFGTLQLMARGNTGKGPLLTLAVLELAGIIAMAFKDNFLNRCLGKGFTFGVLALIVWSSLPSMFYISMFLTGETL